MFKLAKVFHCLTNKDFRIEDNVNIYCSPDHEPGLLLGLVTVIFDAVPSISGDYKNEILIDVGLSKCLSVPIELIVITTKLSECLKSGKLLLEIKSVFGNSGLKIKEMAPNSTSLGDKQLIEKYGDQLKLKQEELYSDNCATLLESTERAHYYEKLCMFLYLEGDHRRRLIQR